MLWVEAYKLLGRVSEQRTFGMCPWPTLIFKFRMRLEPSTQIDKPEEDFVLIKLKVQSQENKHNQNSHISFLIHFRLGRLDLGSQIKSKVDLLSKNQNIPNCSSFKLCRN